MFKTIIRILLFCSVSLSASAQDSLEQDWSRVVNRAFGFEFEAPRAIFTPLSGESEDSRAFASRDGRAALYVLAVRNQDRKTLKDIKDSYLASLKDARATYEQPLRDAIVASGFKEDKIFYLKIALSSDGARAAILDLTYPEDLKRDFDPIVTRISRSFRFIE